MSEKDFVFAADRHGREDEAEGDIYIGAGDEIYTVEAGEDADELEEHETGLYGNADDEEQVAEYAAGELDERFAQLSEEYEEAYIALGNHEDHLLPAGIVQQVAKKYDNINVIQEDLVEIEGRNFYFGDSFQKNSQVEQLYDKEVLAAEAGYEEDDLESIGTALDKNAEEVTCSDVDQILEGDAEIDQSNEKAKSVIRKKLEGLPYFGEKIFQPLYSLKDRYFGSEEETEGFDLPNIEKTEQHEQLDEAVDQYEEILEEKAEKIGEADGEVTLVSHGQPQTEENPNASIETRELLERTDNIDAAYVGHFHGGFEGEKETRVEEVDVINPMEGYTIDHSGGALEDYETQQFEGEKAANADPIELGQLNQEQNREQTETELTEEEQRRAKEIFEEEREKTDSPQEALRITHQRMQGEGIHS